MIFRVKLLLTILSFISFAASGQAIDNTLSFKNMKGNKYFRFNYENDFFSASDKYYTQGVHFELVAPRLAYSPVNHLLIRPRSGYTRYGIGVEHDIYTPANIEKREIQVADRPFASCLILKSFVTNINPLDKTRLSSTLSVGIVGPGAVANELQSWVHRVLPRNSVPQGWSNQVQNDVVINYQVNYEKQLLAWRNIFSLNANAMARLGTLSDKVAAGGTVMLGYFDSPFGGVSKKDILSLRGFRFYAYDHAVLNAIGYDATLQGGVFNHTNPHTLGANEISRINVLNRFGIVLVYKSVHIEYFQTYLSREFKSGTHHHWGGVQIAFGL